MAKTVEEKIAEANDLLDFVMKIQDRLPLEVASPGEAETGEGRRGAIMVRGDNKWTRVFEVVGGRLVPLNTLEGVRTVVAFEGVDAFLKLCQELLAGSPGAFSRMRARGEVRIEGEFAVRDFMVFSRLLTRAGQALNSYGVKVGGE